MGVTVARRLIPCPRIYRQLLAYCDGSCRLVRVTPEEAVAADRQVHRVGLVDEFAYHHDLDMLHGAKGTASKQQRRAGVDAEALADLALPDYVTYVMPDERCLNRAHGGARPFLDEVLVREYSGLVAQHKSTAKSTAVVALWSGARFRTA